MRADAGLSQGLHAPDRTTGTYEELLRRARTALELGESVVLDASWSDARWRAAARDVAAETTSDGGRAHVPLSGSSGPPAA